MVQVDHIVMFVFHRRVAMGMAMGFGPLPAFMLVLMMRIVEVQMLVIG